MRSEFSARSEPDPGTNLVPSLHQVRAPGHLRDAEREAGLPYRIALGREVIELGVVEFRIISLLSARPYHAFSRQAIAEAVSTSDTPIAVAAIDEHIVSLMRQLGVFHDYIQAVPYIGYRFKA